MRAPWPHDTLGVNARADGDRRWRAGPVSREGTVKVDVDANTVVGIVNLGFLFAIWWKLDGKIERTNGKIEQMNGKIEKMNDKIAAAERSLREEIGTNINRVDAKVDDLKNILLQGSSFPGNRTTRKTEPGTADRPVHDSAGSRSGPGQIRASPRRRADVIDRRRRGESTIRRRGA